MRRALIFLRPDFIMRDDAFEWDDDKALRNWSKHHLSFHDARAVFMDPNVIERPDPGQNENEDRFSAIGMVEGRIVFVAYAIRATRIRIISARKAQAHERRRYYR